MIYMCYVIVMNEPLLDLINSNDSSVWSVYSSEGISHGFKVNVSIMSYVIDNEFESLQLNLFWRPKFFNFLNDVLFDFKWLIILLKLEPRVL
jgi:hypothetical protein